jgi:hypothetical protein
MEGDREDISFNKITNKNKNDPDPIISTANYDADIYDTSCDFKSLGVLI